MDLASVPGLGPALRARGYQLRGPAGVGSGGTAWTALDPTGRRVVAAVVDLARLTLAERRSALARLETLRSVSHPHLVRLVDDLPLARDRHVLLTEAVDGPTVGAVREVRPRWAAGEVVTLLVPLAGALEALAAAGLRHLDVAPENVVLAPGGRPVLVDLAGVLVPPGGTTGFSRGAGDDVAALARLGLDLLEGEGPLREVLLGASRHPPTAGDLAAACYRAAAPVPVEVPDPAVLTRVALGRLARGAGAARTLPAPRRLRRRLLAAAAVLLVGLGALLATRLPAVLAPGAVSTDPTPSGPVREAEDAAVALTLLRAEVLASGDPQRLAEVDLPGSRALEADLAVLESLGERPERNGALRAEVASVRWVGTHEGRELVEVTSAVHQGAQRGEHRTVVLVLARSGAGWRVAEVLAPGAVAGS